MTVLRLLSKAARIRWRWSHAYLMLTSNAGGGSGVIATGFYTFRLEHAGGEWRIAELFLDTDNAW